MKRERFISELREECSSRGLVLVIDKVAGKGSHYRLAVGSNKSTVKSGELSPVYMNIVRKQLGLK